MTMIEAVRTTASAGVIWTIVVIMSLCTAFLVAATSVADVMQTRRNRRMRMMVSRMPGATGLPSQRAAQDMLTNQGGPRRPDAVPAGMPSAGTERMDPVNPVPAQRQDAARQAGYSGRGPAAQGAAEAPTEPIPSQGGASSRQAGEAGRHPMPAQRGGESDRAERSFTRPGNRNPDSDEPDPH